MTKGLLFQCGWMQEAPACMQTCTHAYFTDSVTRLVLIAILVICVICVTFVIVMVVALTMLGNASSAAASWTLWSREWCSGEQVANSRLSTSPHTIFGKVWSLGRALHLAISTPGCYSM